MRKSLFEVFSVLKGKLGNLAGSGDEAALSRQNILFSGVTSGVVNNLIGGNFFTGFLLLLSADDGFMGLVAMTGFIGNLLQVFSPLLLERFKSRKRLLVASRAIIYLFNIVIISIVPFISETNSIKLMMILSLILFINLINAVTASGFAVWHIKSIPEDIRAKFFSSLTVINGVIIYILILISSRIIDRFKENGNELQGLLIFRGIALLLCLVDLYFLFKIKEYPNQQSDTNVNLINVLLNPFREKKYLITVIIACLWNFSANIPGPYFGVYMLKNLGISYSFLNLINLANIPVLILLTPLWRRRITTTSWFRTLYFSMGLYLLHYVVLSFVTGATIFLYPIAVIFAFSIAPGINLVFANIPYINIPEKDQTNYIGFFSTMNNLAALLGVLTGKEFIRHTEGAGISLLGITMQNKQYIMLLTACAMLAAVIIIRHLQKKSLVSNYRLRENAH